MQKLKNITSLYFKLITILWLANSTYAQQKENLNFKVQVQSFTINKPNSYQALDTQFNAVSNDTLKMRHLATKSN